MPEDSQYQHLDSEVSRLRAEQSEIRTEVSELSANMSNVMDAVHSLAKDFRSYRDRSDDSRQINWPGWIGGIGTISMFVLYLSSLGLQPLSIEINNLKKADTMLDVTLQREMRLLKSETDANISNLMSDLKRHEDSIGHPVMLEKIHSNATELAVDTQINEAQQRSIDILIETSAKLNDMIQEKQ